jgi:hypothetical protein
VIYPLGGGYNRVEVKKKKEIAAFGPLHHIHIVSDDALPVLVRSTAIFADVSLSSFSFFLLPCLFLYSLFSFVPPADCL